MKNPCNPRGRVYSFKKPEEWNQNEETKSELLRLLSKSLRSHMVIVIDRVVPGWWNVATITTTVDESIDNDLYIPIARVRKNRNTNMQLKLAHDPYGNTLKYPSYLRVERLYTVPLDILEGEIWELKIESYESLSRFIRRRGLGDGTALVSSTEPVSVGQEAPVS